MFIHRWFSLTILSVEEAWKGSGGQREGGQVCRDGRRICRVSAPASSKAEGARGSPCLPFTLLHTFPSSNKPRRELRIEAPP